MLDLDKGIPGRALVLKHLESGWPEFIGDQRGGRQAAPFQFDSVEHTARTARASVPDPGYREMAPLDQLVEDVDRGGGGRIGLGGDDEFGDSVALLEDFAHEQENPVRVGFGVVQQGDDFPVQAVGTGGKLQAACFRLNGWIQHEQSFGDGQFSVTPCAGWFPQIDTFFHRTGNGKAATAIPPAEGERGKATP